MEPGQTDQLLEQLIRHDEYGAVIDKSLDLEKISKKWVNFFSLELEKWFVISLFPLGFQDLKKKILFLFSIYEILKQDFLSLLEFQDF